MSFPATRQGDTLSESDYCDMFFQSVVGGGMPGIPGLKDGRDAFGLLGDGQGAPVHEDHDHGIGPGHGLHGLGPQLRARRESAPLRP